jgi:hypothetical protein
MIGNVATLKDLSLRFTVSHYSSGPTVQFIRVIVFRHKPTSAALTATGAGSLILDDSATSYSINAHRSMEHKQDVVLLYDQTMSVTTYEPALNRVLRIPLNCPWKKTAQASTSDAVNNVYM